MKSIKIFFYKFLILLMYIPGIIIFSGCKGNNDTTTNLIGNWVELSDFEGVARSDAAAFSINDKGYVTTGYDGDDRLKDLWEYDPVRDFWIQKADFPGNARNGAVAFGTSTKGYVGTGYDGSDKLKDFWEFNPDSNKWTQVSDFAGSARYGAIAFSIDNKGYVGTGYDGNNLKDFWMYNPETNEWIQKVSVGGSKRRDAVGFVINGKGYVCTGINNSVYESDFWEYDPVADLWTGKRDIANISSEKYDDDYNIVRTNAVAFSANGIGFVVSGGKGTFTGETWAYDPGTDLWVQKTTLEGATRMEAVSFTLANKGYVMTGRSGGYYYDDIWCFYPNDELNEAD
jgi:N-acetylneuraminic acid mutarotase